MRGCGQSVPDLEGFPFAIWEQMVERKEDSEVPEIEVEMVGGRLPSALPPIIRDCLIPEK